MQQTSILSYHSLSNEALSSRQSQVLEALEEMGSACNRQIAEHTKRPINEITPRINELVKKGHVEIGFKAKDPLTMRQVIYWQVK